MSDLLARVVFYGMALAVAGVVVANLLGSIRMAFWRRKHRQVVSDRWIADHYRERRPWF